MLKILRQSAWMLAACMCVAVLVPATSQAAVTAPVQLQPTTNAQFDEGGSITFSWTGTLQGDPVAINRSFFQVEVAAANKIPAGQQSAWPRRAAWTITRAGQNETQVELGVPGAGEYRWRVCAWGIADHIDSNRQEQLNGGCSPTRALISKAVPAQQHDIGELPISSTETGDVTYITRSVPRPRVEKPVRVPVEPTAPAEPSGPVAAFQPLAKSLFGSGSGSSVSLGDSLSRSGGTGALGSVGRGLGATIPGLPIPFWVLALLAACVPMVIVWRRSILAMFDWEDGSIDGYGTMPPDTGNQPDELQIFQDDQSVKLPNELDDADHSTTAPSVSHDRTAA